MKLTELISRVGRRARGGDFTVLELAEKADVMQSCNTALQTVFNLLPIYFKQMTVGFLLPAPVTVDCAITQYATTLDNAPFTEDQIGHTVIIAGDGNWNQVVAVDKILNPYMGATGDPIQATVYGDSIFSERYPLDRIVGNPRFADQTQLAIIRREMANADSPFYGNLSPSVGQPTQWWTQPNSVAQGENPYLFIRFFPLPDQAYAINVPIAYWPHRLTLDDFVSNSEISVPDQFLDACLIPLAVRELMTTRVFESRGDESLIMDAAQRAETFLKLQVGQVGSPANKVFTPIGF